MARKGLSLLIVAAIIAFALFLLNKCDSKGGGLSPLAKISQVTFDTRPRLQLPL